MKWFKFYGERWFSGSSRFELSIEQRAIWIDLLAKASINEPRGQINYYMLEHISRQFICPIELLESTIKRCIEVNKVKHNPKKKIIKILNWKKYQSEYDRQKPYRQQDKGPLKVTKRADISDEKVTLRREGEERRIEKEEKERKEEKESIRKPESPLGSSTISPSPLLSISKTSIEARPTIKETFLSMLKECKGYPFDEGKDSILFDISVCRYPKINLLKQLGKRIAWWQLHLDALRANPRAQLYKWFKGEFEYQKQGGPQALGDILKEGDDPDYRDLFKKLIGASNEQSKVNKA